MVQGAALADFTMISGFDADITKAIPNGAEVEDRSDGGAAVYPRVLNQTDGVDALFRLSAGLDGFGDA